jgi:hypothetical protein
MELMYSMKETKLILPDKLLQTQKEKKLRFSGRQQRMMS